MNIFFRIFFFMSFIGFFSNCKPPLEKTYTPNIIIFLADDMGYGDLGCYGSTDIKSPNIDKLAEQGVRFTNFYSNGPECTPTRVALLTGRYQQRAGGLECAVGAGNVGRYDEAEWLAKKGELGLPVSENTLLKHLKSSGYQTAMFGKWHLGYEKKFRPFEHGFDHSFGPIGYGGDYFYHTEQVETGMDDLTGMHTLMENNKEVFHKGEYFTDLFTEKALDWLRSRNSEKPFFLYMPYTSPHTPYQGPKDMIARPLRADEWNIGTRETYVEMVESLDLGIGNILNYLKENQLEKETLVIFFSDNGGTKKADNGPFSGNKGQVYEGGIHVPCIIKWPGKVSEDIVSEQTCISFDLTKSILNLIEPKIDEELDGYDILHHVINEKEDFDRTLFWRKKRGNLVHKAIRDGDLKYFTRINGDSVVFEKVVNLKVDPAEINNLLNHMPETAKELKYKLKEWEKEVQSPRLAEFKRQ
ncbi:MAG: sulfatase-like hydrolase/transferase [Draconibacterium sp.]|nr:sulfatase-like hydrolase/transferase [Draconibacterium sp.]